MRKVILLVGSLLLSLNAMAATHPHNLNSAILNAVQKQSNVKIIKASLPMIYGGQNISRPKVATVDGTLWSGQRTLIG
jgi:hypothetical protein